MQIQPNVQELIKAQTRNEVDPKIPGPQIAFTNVQIPFERRYTPSKRPLGDQSPGRFINDAYEFDTPAYPAIVI